MVTLSGKVCFAVDMLKEPKNRGYVIAGIAGIVGFIAFFLPYYALSFFGYYSISGSTAGGILWFEFLATLVAIAVSAVLIYRPTVFGLKDMPFDKQIRYGIYAIIGAGAVGLLVELFALSNLTGYGLSLGIGWWLYLFSAVAMVVGGVMALRNPQTLMGNTWQYPGAQYPQQPYPPQQQYPQQMPPQQYPPQYPPTDPHTGYPQQPYPPQPYSPQQMPPQQQYPQQPYPPQQMPPQQ